MKPRVSPWGFVASLTALFLFTGCESMQYSQYQGQQRAWPTGSALTTGVYDVPVYRGWPEKPYDVIALIQFDQANVDWNQGDAKQAAKMAAGAGGDAIILLPGGADPSPTSAAMRKDLAVGDNRSVAVVVKWK